MKTINRIIEVYYSIDKYIMGIILAVNTIVVFVATIGRYSGWFNLAWAEELARYTMIWTAFLGCSLAARYNLHFNVPALIDMLPKRGRQVVYVIHIILMAFICYIMAKYAIQNVGTSIKMSQLSSMLKIPMWFIYISMPIGVILCFFGYLRNRVQEIIKANRGEDVEKGGNEK